jgi:HAD superfamily hydrolase (TIGR01509 family)
LNEACDLGADNNEFKDYLCDQLAEFYRTVATVKEGAFELLEHLKNNGVKLCLATATQSEYAKIAYTTLGLDKYLPIFISCTDIGKGKDQPDIYLKALELLGTAPEDTYVFEDSFVALKTASSIGIHPVGIYDKYNFHKDLESISEIYVGRDNTLRDLIDVI